MFKRFVILRAAVTVVLGFLSVANARTSPRSKPTATPKSQGDGTAPDPADDHAIGWKSSPDIGEKGTIGPFYDDRPASGRNGFKVIQVVDESNAVALLQTNTSSGKEHCQPETIWITMPTADMVDDRVYETFNQWFEVTGTKKYTTALGATKTVMVLKAIDKPVSAAALKKKADAAAASKERELAELKKQLEKDQRAREANRTWTYSADGKTMKATFVSRIGDKVILEKEDGTSVKVPVDNLSEADQQWIANRSKK